MWIKIDATIEPEVRQVSPSLQGERSANEREEKWDTVGVEEIPVRMGKRVALLLLGKMEIGHVSMSDGEKLMFLHSAQGFERDCCLLYEFYGVKGFGKDPLALQENGHEFGQ